MNLTNDGTWQEVIIPNPVERLNHKRGKSIKTKSHEAMLLGILKAPPTDFDGSNKKLAGYMGMSERNVTRLLNGLKAAGKIKVDLARPRHPQLGYYTLRTIHIKREF